MKTPKDMDVGSIHETNNHGSVKVIDYSGSANVTVKFLNTGYVKKCQSSAIRLGAIKDKLDKSVYGVGCIGDGEHNVISNGKQERKYKIWIAMLQRCYSEDLQKRDVAYKGCTVCDEWHNYQNFADWYESNYPSDGLVYEIDKDIKVDGNKVYSPETCLFVTHKENTIKARAKTYIFKSPEGELVEIYNLKDFCEGKDIDERSMHMVHKGKRNHHKGWTIP